MIDQSNKHFPNDSYFEIAGFNIQVKIVSKNRTTSTYSFELNPRILLSGFLINKPKKVDFQIILEQCNSFFTFKKSKTDNNTFLYFYRHGKNTIRSFQHISHAQFFYILSLAVNQLLANDRGFMIHASAVKHKGKALIFLGNSGAGKSTIIKMLSDVFPPLADDSLIIRNIQGRYTAYQTFYIEKNDIGNRKKGGYVVSNVFFLKKATSTKAQLLIKKSDIVPRVLVQIGLNLNGSSKRDLFQICHNFVQNFSNFHQLVFSLKKKEIVDALISFLDTSAKPATRTGLLRTKTRNR